MKSESMKGLGELSMNEQYYILSGKKYLVVNEKYLAYIKK